MLTTPSNNAISEPDFSAIENQVLQSDWVKSVLKHEAFALATPNPINDALPTLAGATDDMDLQSADILHMQASRWLEYIERKIAMQEAEYVLASGEASQYKRRLDFKSNKKIQNLNESELDKLDALERSALEREAVLVALRGVKSGLDKIKAAASRTITRHTKANLGLD